MKGGWKLTGIVNNGHEIVIDISFSYCLLNSSGANFNMNALRSAIDKSIVNCYNVTFYDEIFEPHTIKSNLDNYPSRTIMTHTKMLNRVRVTVNSRVVNATSQRHTNEHLLEIKNLKPGLYGEANFIGGSTVSINSAYVPDIIKGSDRNTIPHELGHTLGLLHVDENYHILAPFGATSVQYWTPNKQKQFTTNMMFSGRSPYMNDSLSTRINILQIKRLAYNIKNNKINR